MKGEKYMSEKMYILIEGKYSDWEILFATDNKEFAEKSRITLESTLRCISLEEVPFIKNFDDLEGLSTYLQEKMKKGRDGKFVKSLKIEIIFRNHNEIKYDTEEMYSLESDTEKKLFHFYDYYYPGFTCYRSLETNESKEIIMKKIYDMVSKIKSYHYVDDLSWVEIFNTINGKDSDV